MRARNVVAVGVALVVVVACALNAEIAKAVLFFIGVSVVVFGVFLTFYTARTGQN